MYFCKSLAFRPFDDTQMKDVSIVYLRTLQNEYTRGSASVQHAMLCCYCLQYVLAFCGFAETITAKSLRNIGTVTLKV